MISTTTTTSLGAARTLAADVLGRAGMPDEPAHRSAELIILADVWGVGSHGVLRLPYYLERLVAGGLNPHAALRRVRDSGATIAYDGDDGLGHWQAWEAAEAAAARAAEHGIAVASVASSSHCGCLGLYTLPGIRRDLVTMVFSTGPAVMAAPGMTTPTLSTSPLAVGIPCRPRPAIVDLATSAVARGTIAAHARRAEPLADGWAMDASGTPTTDPGAALSGMLAPLGGGKGFALAFMVEALAGAAVGPALAMDVPDMFDTARNADPQRIGHLVITFDPALVAADDSSQRRLDELADRVTRAGGRLPGARRRLPWELTEDTPVQLPGSILDELKGWSP